MSENPKLLSILSDQPADEDQLDFAPYAKTLADIVADPGTDTPLTIGVFGGWGRGKTSLMRMVQRRLEETDVADFVVRPVWFNAWLYSREQALWRALVSRVLAEVRGFPSLSCDARDDLRRLEARLYPPTAPTGGLLTLPPDALPGLGGGSLPTLTGLELLRRQAARASDEDAAEKLQELIADVEESEALTRRDQIAALDGFRRQFEAVSRTCIVPHGRLAVFVDDLDRCLPDKAVEVLEAVKLFLDVPGCAFILGVSREVIEEGIRVRYADYEARIDGALYLEKIIQLPFNLPPIQTSAVQAYVNRVTAGNLPDARCETVFSVGLEPNPRRIKRTLNIFLLLWRLAQNRGDLQDAIKPVRLAKMVIIQQYHPRLFALVTTGPHYLIDLEKRFRQDRGAGVTQEAGEADLPLSRQRERPALSGAEGGAGGEGDISAGPLTEFLGRGLLRDLLTCTAPEEADANFIDLTPAGVSEYIYLTRSAVEEKAVQEEAARLPFEPQMVSVPAGPFLMGTPERELDELEKLGVERKYLEWEAPQHEVTLDAYAISRYPVTNAEFARFIEDGGYTTRDYWTDAGWQQKENERWTQPRLWEDDKWNDPSQPVVGVSWYEATAYCRWLSARSGRAYRLPSEAEWEKAARGSDGRRYPWGNDWDASKCNNKESGPGQTTPVGQYPEGDSPYGAGEMVGQVWEWCQTKWEESYRDYKGDDDPEGDSSRALRGGSWYSDSPAGVCRCAFRLRNNPRLWNNGRGFRCVRTSSS
jgi:formylglycine-generating enzyme required for sulfatase activity